MKIKNVLSPSVELYSLYALYWATLPLMCSGRAGTPTEPMRALGKWTYGRGTSSSYLHATYKQYDNQETEVPTGFPE